MDDALPVVKAALNLPIDYLTSLIGTDELIKRLTELATKIWCKTHHKWFELGPILFTKLCKLIPPDYDELTLLKTVIPFFFVSKKENLLTAEAILSSKLSNHNGFLKAICQRK